jgi:hypothetical protein
MNQSPPFPISDELLSAYIDDDVSEVEKQQIEFAIANDPEIAWQVETLRATVALLREMPAIPLPRSFVLQEDQVADILQTRRTASRTDAGASSRGIWQRLLGFMNTGNLALRNASAVAAALFVIITVSRTFVAGGPILPMVAQSDQVVMFEAAPAAAPNPPEEAAPSIMIATGEDVASARTESQPADTTEMPADAARTMLEEQPASEDQAASPQQAAPRGEEVVQTMTFETGAAEAPPAPQGADTTSMRSMAVAQPTPAPEPVPEAAESRAMDMAAGAEESTDSSLQMGEPQIESAEMGMAQLAPASEGESSTESEAASEAEMGIAAAAAETTPNAGSPESSTADTAALDPSAAKTTSVEPQDDESAETLMMEGDATIAPLEEAQGDTLSMDNEASADVVGQPAQAESAAVNLAPSDRVTAPWDVWQIMQISVLALALILLLLWLGSRQRSSR